MAHVITFSTKKFDVSKETPNPINPIAGQSVLRWLREELAKSDCKSTEPDTEDWGWYIEVEAAGASYLVGASADAESSSEPVEWTVQIHKIRSLKEKLLGRNKMTPDDPFSAMLESIVRADTTMEDVSVDRNA